MTTSLRRRLLITLLSAMTGVWFVTVLVDYLDNKNAIKTILDAGLAKSAQLLMARSSHVVSSGLVNKLPNTISIDYQTAKQKGFSGYFESNLTFQVWLDKNNLILRSSNAPDKPLSGNTEGYSDEILAGHRWRVFSLKHGTLPILVQVGEDYGSRNEYINQLQLRMVAPMLITLPLLALVIWYSVTYAIGPIKRLAREVSARDPNHLDEIRPIDPPPRELQPLVQALNVLLARLQKALDTERYFTADAAHELRTPLAAIRAQTQVAQNAADSKIQQEALNKIVTGVDKATHVVQQLLTLARVDPAIPLSLGDKADLCELAGSIIADLAPRALRQKIDISLSEPCQTKVMGNAEMLAILITNLVDNAIHYTPEGGEVLVRITPDGNTVHLSVSDSGPGIPLEERDKVMQRFYRGRNVTQSGSGLGLSIAKRIVELHRGSISLSDSSLGGLRVDVTLIRADDSDPKPSS